MRTLLASLSVVLAACLLFFLVQSRHWPLVGDATLVHYLVLLMDHGMAPYRDIVDAQTPGTYLVDWVVLHTFDGGAVGLRLFDYALMLTAIAAMLVMAWPYDRFAGFMAGGLLALFHGRDGVVQAGQRDLMVAVLLLVATAAALGAMRLRRPMLLAASAFLMVTAATIKPTAILAGCAVLLVALLRSWRDRREFVRALSSTVTGAAVPLAISLIFLMRERALQAFLDAVHQSWPYYASLGRRPLGFLLLHSFSPVMPLLCVGLLLAVLSVAGKKPRAVLVSAEKLWEMAALYAAMLLSLISYVMQGKGYPYHRYPFLAFLLLVLMLHFTQALRSANVFVRAMGLAGTVIAALILAPISAYKITQFDWRNDEYYQQLSGDLRDLGGAALSTHVQCLDTYAGCVNALYRMGLVQSTGFTADLYLWGPPTTGAATPPVILNMREKFRDDLQANPPQVFVVTRQVFLGDAVNPDTYDKVERWPEFAAYLHAHYHLLLERSFPHPVRWSSREDHPPGYRIYVRNAE